MTRRTSVFLLAVALLVAHSLAYSQVRKIPGRTTYQPITTAQAKDHIGEEATVCGKVVSARYAPSSRGRPTFLNLDRPHPNQEFTVVIWEKHLRLFYRPEQFYAGAHICVTGRIESYQGAPQVEVKEPQQIEIKSLATSESHKSYPGVYRIGGGVSPPTCMKCPDPVPKKSREAKLQGAVLLWCIVDEKGRAREIRVVEGLSMGLDEAAVRAVRRWRFRPASRKGKPVPVFMNIEVNFRLK